MSPILTLFACISKPLWLNIRSTGAEVAGGQFHASWVTKTESSLSQVPRPRPRLEGSKTKTKTLRFQDRDRDSRVPRPRPRPRLWGSKTETETRGFQDQDQDSEVPRPRPRPRLVKTGLETKTQVSRTPSLHQGLCTFRYAEFSARFSLVSTKCSEVSFLCDAVYVYNVTFCDFNQSVVTVTYMVWYRWILPAFPAVFSLQTVWVLCRYFVHTRSNGLPA